MDFKAWKLPEEIQVGLQNRPPLIIPIMGKIESGMVNDIIKSLLSISREQSLLLLFDSTGGKIQSGMKLISHLKMLDVPIACLAMGNVASMALIIYLSMPKITRFALPGSMFLAHLAIGEPSISGQIDTEEEMLKGLSFEQANRLFKLKWDGAIEDGRIIRKMWADLLGEEINYRGEKISLDEFLLYDDYFPARVAQEIGIVHQVVVP